jgi:hypothetical protein
MTDDDTPRAEYPPVARRMYFIKNSNEISIEDAEVLFSLLLLPHCALIITDHHNTLIYPRNSFVHDKEQLPRIRLKFALLNSKRNFDDPRFCTISGVIGIARSIFVNLSSDARVRVREGEGSSDRKTMLCELGRIARLRFRMHNIYNFLSQPTFTGVRGNHKDSGKSVIKTYAKDPPANGKIAGTQNQRSDIHYAKRRPADLVRAHARLRAAIAIFPRPVLIRIGNIGLRKSDTAVALVDLPNNGAA